MRSDLPARGSPTTTTCSRGTKTNDSNPLNRMISTRAIRVVISVDRPTVRRLAHRIFQNAGGAEVTTKRNVLPGLREL